MTDHSKAALAGWISDWIRRELAFTGDVIAADATFVRFGMDSVHAMMMVGDLEEHLDRRLSPTLAWDHPTVDAMASHLAADGRPASASRESPPVAASDLLGRIDQMSEAELDALLERERREER